MLLSIRYRLNSGLPMTINGLSNVWTNIKRLSEHFDVASWGFRLMELSRSVSEVCQHQSLATDLASAVQVLGGRINYA